MTNGRDVQVENMDAAVMDVRTDKDQMKVELKPQKAETMKSHPYTKVALAGIFCLSLCVNVALSALLASKETCITGVASRPLHTSSQAPYGNPLLLSAVSDDCCSASNATCQHVSCLCIVCMDLLH